MMNAAGWLRMRLLGFACPAVCTASLPGELGSTLAKEQEVLLIADLRRGKWQQTTGYLTSRKTVVACPS